MYLKDIEDKIIKDIQEEITCRNITKDTFEDSITEIIIQIIDNELMYYEDQIKAIKNFHLYDFSHLDNPQTIGEVAFQGVYMELCDMGKVFDIESYQFNSIQLIVTKEEEEQRFHNITFEDYFFDYNFYDFIELQLKELLHIDSFGNSKVEKVSACLFAQDPPKDSIFYKSLMLSSGKYWFNEDSYKSNNPISL